jgi:hypothetical protein
MVAVAIVGAGVASAVGGAVSGEAQAGAASKAAGAQTAAAQQANQISQQEFNQTQTNIQPFVQGGQQAQTQLNSLLGLNGDPTSALQTLQNMPGYQFQLQQGLLATQNQQTAAGLGQSGSALKAAAGYATGLANSNYQGFETNLQNLVNSGSNAAAGLGNLGQQAVNTQSNNLIGAGSAQAAAANAQALPVTNAVSGVSSGVQNVSNLYLLNGLLQSQGGAGLFGNNSNPNNTPSSTALSIPIQ